MSGPEWKSVVKARTLDFDRVDDQSKEILMSLLDDFDLSVRTRNILINAGMRVLGEAIQLSESEWLRFENCGSKTVREIKALASQFGLTLGTSIQNWPDGDALDPLDADINQLPRSVSQRPIPIVEIDFDHVDKQTRAWLVEELKELDFSVRSQNVFAVIGLKTVSDLIECSKTTLSHTPNCGRRTLEEIESFLSRRGLRSRHEGLQS